ncbi:FtsX-like permease family protein [Sphingomonas sp. LY29]|uniref:ABC transporter permease n=1 Tax=Sphingomonas sp. LY29 TaxID=3095341 RepID=UPI002D77ED20|nr:FtsX-like permease family protein [Sphingomonas sp. LY29]WRP25040.1 FtsX-like permease family protein [Sphingomonas sp. LY29]
MTDDSRLGWAASWRLARRDLSGGLRGLRLLFICLLLGVTTLGAIGSMTAAMTSELATQGQSLLGGDLEVAMTQRRASAEERQELSSFGTVSDTIRTRAMARAMNGGPAVLTELKGVDARYPLYGTIGLANGKWRTLAADEVVIDRSLAERLEVRPGGLLTYGDAQYRIADILTDEPDRVGEGFTLGPVALVSVEGIERSGLLRPGALYESKYRLRLPAGASTETIEEAIKDRFPSAGWEIKDRDRAAPGTSRFFERLGQFLSLIGLAALAIAGIGVGNGVASYMATKRESITTLKVVGATSRDIARIYLLQVGAVTLAAVAAGLVAGALLANLLILATGDLLPVAPGFGLFPQPLIVAGLYGLLIALMFAFPPIDRARSQPAAAGFRGLVDGPTRFARRTWVIVGLSAAAIMALALATARDPLFAAMVIGSVVGVLLLLLGVGLLIRRLARSVPRLRQPLPRLAVANLYRPGAQTVALVIALGLALTLFVTIAAIQTSLSAEISRTVPQRAPNQFVLDVPSEARVQFAELVRREAPEAELNIVPSLRGTIVAYDGKRVADLAEIPDGAWFLRGERGLTYSDTVPQGSDLTAGEWWPKDYRGPPLVSLDEEAAEVLDIGVGDTMTVSVLGREIEAKIASLRRVNWDTMGFNYVLVFSPSALSSAPHSLTSTIHMDEKNEGAVSRALVGAFPSASIISIGEVIGKVRTLLDQMALAILMSASVTILAGIAVLVGAIAASRQARAYDSVILKTLGATRGQVLATQALEYALLAAILVALALALGSAAAWYVIVQIFEFNWAPDWPVVLATLAGGAVLTLGIGILGSLPLMAIRPAAALRRV